MSYGIDGYNATASIYEDINGDNTTYGYNLELNYGKENFTSSRNMSIDIFMSEEDIYDENDEDVFNSEHFWDDYDWTIIQDLTGEEMSNEDKDALSDVASGIEGFLTKKSARTLAASAFAAGTAWLICQ